MSTESMETLTEAIDRLRADGYEHDFFAVADGKLRCRQCGRELDASRLTITDVVRFEGESDPEDESVLYGLSANGAKAGLYSPPYGSSTTPEDIAVIDALQER
jgi:hypothetical protein